MKLSIITCTYNSEKYLQECIDSVINQNLDINEYEHIFVDAYSKDKTKSIIKEYMSKYKNVRLIEREPKWVYNAMNEWIKEAKWGYVMCLNSDDYLEKNVMSWYLKYIRETGNKDLYYGKLNIVNDWIIKYWVNDGWIKIRKKLFELFWSNVLIYHPTVLVKRNTLIDMWLFHEDKKIASDYWMWLNMYVNHKKFSFYPHNITYFRSWDWSLSSNTMLWEDEVHFFQKMYLPKINYQIALIIDKMLLAYNKILLKLS